MVTAPHVRAETFIVPLLGMRLDFSITEIGEPILVSIADIVIFEARVFDGLEEMNGLMHEEISELLESEI